MDQDDLLVEGCKAGNQQAQIGVYRKYYRPVYNTCLRIVNNTADAEDLMQNSFIDAFNRIKSYKGPSAFAGWLKKIAVNNAIDFLARQRPQLEIHGSPADIADAGDSENEEFIEYRVEQIKKALNEIHVEYRIILSLYLFEGYDHQEIGEILKISQANVRTRISRAKQSLIRHIEMMQTRNGSIVSSNNNGRKRP